MPIEARLIQFDILGTHARELDVVGLAAVIKAILHYFLCFNAHFLVVKVIHVHIEQVLVCVVLSRNQLDRRNSKPIAGIDQTLHLWFHSQKLKESFITTHRNKVQYGRAGGDKVPPLVSVDDNVRPRDHIPFKIEKELKRFFRLVNERIVKTAKSGM